MIFATTDMDKNVFKFFSVAMIVWRQHNLN